MNRFWGRLRVDTPGVRITILLFVVLLGINFAAVWTILTARRNVQAMAVQDLALQTTAHARSVEALLATLRGEFLFLSGSAPMTTATSVLSNRDPLRQRWGRLDIEGQLILFLQAHPEVSRIVLRSEEGHPLVVAARREDAPVLLPVTGFREPAQSGAGTWPSTWPIGDGTPANGFLESLLETGKLLRIAAPGAGNRLRIVEQELNQPARTLSADSMLASEPIRDNHWNRPIRWTLIRTENQSQLIASVASLASHYRNTIILNLAVISLTLILGVMAFRQIHRSALLEAENQHQAQVRELERQMMHSERLAGVGRLAAGLAHEINNPLEGMSNYLSLLEEDLRAGRTDGCLELASGIREGVTRAAGITRQVLALSDPGRAPKMPLDLREVARETFEFVRANPAFRHVRLSMETPGDPIVIRGNRITLGQVILNLLLNACEYQSDGGEVELRIEALKGQAQTTVCDRGPGIPDEALPRIFEPFFSMRGSTGLGLSLCHSIVTEHSGEIVAENRTDGGARFVVRIPLWDAESAQRAGGEHDLPPRGAGQETEA